MKPSLVTGASADSWAGTSRACSSNAAIPVRALVRPGSRVDGARRRDRSPATCATPHRSSAPSRAADWSSTSPPTTACGPRTRSELYRSNVDGTRNLLAAARRAGVERVVYTSTVGCIGIPHGGIGDEDTPVTLEDMAGDYKRSKFMAEAGGAGVSRATDCRW